MESPYPAVIPVVSIERTLPHQQLPVFAILKRSGLSQVPGIDTACDPTWIPE
jgi:hypothetical protein